MFVTDYTKHLLDNVKKIHFIGCGGSGMYPLIQILHAKGYIISGSDVLDGSIIRYEREMGVKVSLGHSADNVIGTDLVVYSAAIAKDNVELNAADSYGIPPWSAASCWAMSAACTKTASASPAPTARRPPRP